MNLKKLTKDQLDELSRDIVSEKNNRNNILNDVSQEILSPLKKEFKTLSKSTNITITVPIRVRMCWRSDLTVDIDYDDNKVYKELEKSKESISFKKRINALDLEIRRIAKSFKCDPMEIYDIIETATRIHYE